MIEARRLRKEIEVPKGVEVTLDHFITIKANGNEVAKRLFYPTVEIKKEENKIVIEPKKFSKREKKIINTFESHLKNMIKGVQDPFTYKVQICSGHFPMTVNVIGKEKIVVKNFLGEKVPREAAIASNTVVKVEGDIIVISSPNKEAAGQTAGNFEKSTRITNRDKRIFQDGLWIIEKAGKAL
jgi:large subunit ribosomal protein L6